MTITEPKKVLAVLSDLFFMVKIKESAKRAGLAIEFLKSEMDVLERAKALPELIIIDLNCAGLDPLNLIRSLKANPETKGISLLAYVSHVQGELKLQAQEAGCDAVMPRSAFSLNLLQIMQRHAG